MKKIRIAQQTSSKKLEIHRETLRRLHVPELRVVIGGNARIDGGGSTDAACNISNI